MSLLGLEDYGSNSEESPAPGGGGVDAAPAAAAGSGRNLLSVVEYGAEADAAELAAERKGAEQMGVSLDEDELDRAAQTSRVGGVGVQVSVVKRASAAPSSGNLAAAADDSPAASRTAPPASDAAPAEFVVPDSPPGELNARTMEKYLGYVAAANEGNKINDHIRHSKKFRNPCLLDKLVAFLGVQEFGTNYPPELYDPTAFSRDEYYEVLEEARREWEHRQARKQGEKVEFRSSGSQQQMEASTRPSGTASAAAVPGAAVAAAASAAAACAAAASSAQAAGGEAAPAKRKSKWDNAGNDKQRPRQ